MGVAWSQMYPAPAGFTEKDVASQERKVFIVTGGYSGIGLELVKILYGTGATVYIAGRNEETARDAIKSIESSDQQQSNPGQLKFLFVDLSDLSTIKPAVQEFKDKEARLDVVWNNAGVSQVAIGSKSKQGHELTMAINCLGAFLFTQLLLPILESTAKMSTAGNVRVVWLGSQMIDFMAPTGGFEMEHIYNPPKDSTVNYTNSKTGDWFLCSELGKHVNDRGILSVCLNPGNLQSNILRNAKWMRMMVSWWLLHPPIKGAYVELYAGLSPDLTMTDQGKYIIPPGRRHSAPRQDLLSAMKDKDEGGTGRAGEFWLWCDEKTRDYA